MHDPITAKEDQDTERAHRHADKQRIQFGLTPQSENTSVFPGQHRPWSQDIAEAGDQRICEGHDAHASRVDAGGGGAKDCHRKPIGHIPLHLHGEYAGKQPLSQAPTLFDRCLRRPSADREAASGQKEPQHAGQPAGGGNGAKRGHGGHHAVPLQPA